MNICLIGYGSIARLHLEALQGTEARLYSVVGRLPEPTAEFAREFGCERHTIDLEMALADRAVDAVIVCSPTDLHAEQTERALQAGKHVLCEIPLATSLAETDTLDQLAHVTDRRLMVCHTQRFWPNHVLAHEIVASQRLRPYHVVYRHLMLRRDNVNWMGRTRSWVDNLLWLLGATEGKVASGAVHWREARGNPMDIGIVMQATDDRLATVALSYDSHIEVKDCQVICEEDSLWMEGDRLRNSTGWLYEPQSGGQPKDVARRLQAEEFLSAVREGREPTTGVAAIRPAMAVLQAVQDQVDA